MKIAGYLKTSLIEWPGQVAAVVFTVGCNFHCPFCHNRDLVDPGKESGLKLISETEIIKDLSGRKKWIDAVVVTGGEPTFQTDLTEFLGKIKDLGFLRMVQTNGSRPEIVKRLIADKLVDYFSLDVKTFFSNYPKVTGVKSPAVGDDVKQTLVKLLQSGLPFELRTTVVPKLHPEKDLIKMAEEIRETAITEKGSRGVAKIKWFLQQFQPVNCLDTRFEKEPAYGRTELQTIVKKIKKIIPGVHLRGLSPAE